MESHVKLTARIIDLMTKGHSDSEIEEMLGITLTPDGAQRLHRTALGLMGQIDEREQNIEKAEKPKTTRVEINRFVPGKIKTSEQMRLDALEDEVRNLKEQLGMLREYCTSLSDRITFINMR